MSLRVALTLLVSKIVIMLLRLLGRGATTLPGKIAEALTPGISGKLSDGIKVIMVTGTNGKTTTSRIISKILQENGVKFMGNKSGANLVSGVTTAFINAVTLSGNKKVDTAVIEIDEAAFKVISKYIKPDILVVTNFFRDQLDRFGELYSTLNSVKSGIFECKNTKLVLNADDSLCASLASETGNSTIFFGMHETAYKGEPEYTNADAMFCIFCRTKYYYTNHTYGHLGNFECPNCGYKKPSTSVTCTAIHELASENSNIEINIKHIDETFDVRINLPGLYNIYNALAAVTCGTLLGYSVDSMIKALENFESGFGRMETIEANEKFIKLILVKNPTGYNQVLNHLLSTEDYLACAFILNDNIADGTDVSWIWDVDFDKLTKLGDKIKLFSSGIRAEDMAVRLKYAGLDTSKIVIEKHYAKLISDGLSEIELGESFYILPTYTAMLEIRKYLESEFGVQKFWK